MVQSKERSIHTISFKEPFSIDLKDETNGLWIIVLTNEGKEIVYSYSSIEMTKEEREKLKNVWLDMWSKTTPQAYHVQIEYKNGFLEDWKYTVRVLTERSDEKTVIVTRRIVKSHEELKHQLLFSSLYENHADAILSLDDNGYISKFNLSFATLFGYSQEADENLNWKAFFRETEHSKINHLFLKAFEGEKLVISSTKVIHKDGHELFVEIQSLPIILQNKMIGVHLFVRDVKEDPETEQAIQYFTFHDSLTGLFNRKALLVHLNEEKERCMIKESEFSILYIDLDRFKQINSTLGHQTGDHLLQLIGERLNRLTGKSGEVYRHGGDEFVFLLKKSTRKKTEWIANQIIHLFEQPFMIEDQELFLTPSIGISQFPMDGKNPEQLIKNADEALFQVKEKGRSHYRFYRSDMKQAFPNYILMESHLRKAIEKDELSVHYQPQMNLETGKVESFEALLRWENRTFGSVSPAEFIPLAEDSGLIITIGEWVIQQACKQAKIWREKGDGKWRIAVNISPLQFQDTRLIDIIIRELNQNDLPAEALEIEITEGAMKDKRLALSTLVRLKEIGVKISVDDFGTGYSSLNYLKHFPIDILKIDQSFVRDIMLGQKDAAITKTIIHLAHHLGMEVVAEGVELQEQVQFLLEAKCQKAQGFLFGRPSSPSDTEKRFAASF